MLTCRSRVTRLAVRTARDECPLPPPVDTPRRPSAPPSPLISAQVHLSSELSAAAGPWHRTCFCKISFAGDQAHEARETFARRVAADGRKYDWIDEFRQARLGPAASIPDDDVRAGIAVEDELLWTVIFTILLGGFAALAALLLVPRSLEERPQRLRGERVSRRPPGVRRGRLRRRWWLRSVLVLGSLASPPSSSIRSSITAGTNDGPGRDTCGRASCPACR